MSKVKLSDPPFRIGVSLAEHQRGAIAFTRRRGSDKIRLIAADLRGGREVQLVMSEEEATYLSIALGDAIASRHDFFWPPSADLPTEDPDEND